MKSWTTKPIPHLPGTGLTPVIYDSSQRDYLRTPEHSNDASLYVCGITPYDSTHLGHAATYVAFDVLNRVWRDAGFQVSYVQNVTDVDEPLLERAERDGVDWRELAHTEIDRFHDDMEALNVLAPDYYIGAVESMERIVPVVEGLLERGYAYMLDGAEPDVYFDTQAVSALDRSVPESWYLGQVSRLSKEQMLPLFAERGGDPERAGKKDPLDPLLWRSQRPGEPSWPGASLGPGRPGWHIECAVIAREFLPAPFTVQGGGSDLSFPHHEMGAGHAWAMDEHPLAERYMHSGMVGLDGEKMSKSRGNLVFVSKLREQGVEPAAIRVLILDHHYRSDWMFTRAQLDWAVKRLRTWRSALSYATEGSAATLLSALRETLAQDLNTPAALSALDGWAERSLSSASGAAIGSVADAEVISAAVNALLGVEV